MPNHQVPAHLVITGKLLGEALVAIFGYSKFVLSREGANYIVQTQIEGPANLMDELLSRGAVTATS